MCKKVYNEEQLNIILDRVNSWVNNCDQKASILLAFLGALGTIIITSDIVSEIKNSLLKPIGDYFRDISNNTFPLKASILVLLLIILIAFLSWSLYQFILTIQSRRRPEDYNKETNDNFDGTITDSLIYFDTISKMDYNQFQSNLERVNESEYNYLKDLCSQIYINSCVCSIKFDHYEKGLTALKRFLIVLLVFIILFLVFYSK